MADRPREWITAAPPAEHREKVIRSARNMAVRMTLVIGGLGFIAFYITRSVAHQHPSPSLPWYVATLIWAHAVLFWALFVLAYRRRSVTELTWQIDQTGIGRPGNLKGYGNYRAFDIVVGDLGPTLRLYRDHGRWNDIPLPDGRLAELIGRYTRRRLPPIEDHPRRHQLKTPLRPLPRLLRIAVPQLAAAQGLLVGGLCLPLIPKGLRELVLYGSAVVNPGAALGLMIHLRNRRSVAPFAVASLIIISGALAALGFVGGIVLRAIYVP